jgi:Protein of unknown function (DUF3574)
MSEKLTPVAAIAAAFLFVPCIALVAACTGLGPQSCPAGQQGMITEYLYFGAAKPDGQVSANDWRAFLDEVVTPRFPQGLSAWQASGQWKAAAGPVIHEPSYVLNVVHESNEATDAAIIAIVEAYKARFLQEAVLRIRSSACVSF